MMQETSRLEEAAAALAAGGQRVTHQRMDRWLRERDGFGCSPRDSSPVVKRYRQQAEPDMHAALAQALSALERLPEWQRHRVIVQLRKHGREA